MKISLKTPDGQWIWEKDVDIKEHFRRELDKQEPPPSPGQKKLFRHSRQTAHNWHKRAVKKESPKPSFPIGKEKILARAPQKIFKNYSGFQDYLRLISISGAVAIVHYRKTRLRKDGKQEFLDCGPKTYQRAGRWTWRELPPRQKRVRSGAKSPKILEVSRPFAPGILETRRMIQAAEADRGRGSLSAAGEGALAGAALKETQAMGRSGLSPPGKKAVATLQTAPAAGSGPPKGGVMQALFAERKRLRREAESQNGQSQPESRDMRKARKLWDHAKATGDKRAAENARAFERQLGETEAEKMARMDAELAKL